jgi:hypothetical protein
LTDEREQAVLDPVPLAGAWKKVADCDVYAQSVARRWSSRFHSRSREPLLPAPSAVIMSLSGPRPATRDPDAVLAGNFSAEIEMKNCSRLYRVATKLNDLRTVVDPNLLTIMEWCWERGAYWENGDPDVDLERRCS